MAWLEIRCTSYKLRYTLTWIKIINEKLIAFFRNFYQTLTEHQVRPRKLQPGRPNFEYYDSIAGYRSTEMKNNKKTKSTFLKMSLDCKKAVSVFDGVALDDEDGEERGLWLGRKWWGGCARRFERWVWMEVEIFSAVWKRACRRLSGMFGISAGNHCECECFLMIWFCSILNK